MFAPLKTFCVTWRFVPLIDKATLLPANIVVILDVELALMWTIAVVLSSIFPVPLAKADTIKLPALLAKECKVVATPVFEIEVVPFLVVKCPPVIR